MLCAFSINLAAEREMCNFKAERFWCYRHGDRLSWGAASGEKMALNIFEPRYRLMVRRCMEGARRFGMATIGPSHVLHDVACECEIMECQPQPDGCIAEPTIVLKHAEWLWAQRR